jgi:hypothetical protein
MEIILVLVILAIGLVLYYNSRPTGFDINKDGKVDKQDLVAGFDINKDGKVDKQDVAAAAVKVEEVVVAEVKEVATKVKTAAKKVAAKKPAVKKAKA